MKKVTSKMKLRAAKEIAALINAKVGMDEVEVVVDGDGLANVVWEGGPYEWAPALTGGSSIFAGEFGDYGEENPWYDEFAAICDKYGVYCECNNSFSLSVWPV